MKILPTHEGKPSTLLLLFLLFCLAQSCNKESLDIGAATISAPALLPSCDEPCGESDSDCYPTSVLEAVTDFENSGNDRINMILYHYGVVFKSALGHPNYKELVLTALMSNSEEAISLLDLGKEYPAFGNFLNENLRTSISCKDIYPKNVEPDIKSLLATPEWDANAYLANKMSYEGYTYL